MARKNYSDEFRRQADESTPGATMRASPMTWASSGARCATGSTCS
jgi:hypothetical protein